MAMCPLSYKNSLLCSDSAQRRKGDWQGSPLMKHIAVASGETISGEPHEDVLMQ